MEEPIIAKIDEITITLGARKLTFTLEEIRALKRALEKIEPTPREVRTEYRTPTPRSILDNIGIAPNYSSTFSPNCGLLDPFTKL